MNIVVNEELAKLNIDILIKLGMKKSTINKLHKLKAKELGDIADIDTFKLEQLLEEDGKITVKQMEKLLSLALNEFVQALFESVKEDPCYEMVMLHVNNHTHQEIAQKYGSSKEKIKQNISKFLQNLFTLVDAVGNKLITNKPYIGIEELEQICASDDGYKLLLLAFKVHDTKWVYHYEAECFTKK